MVLHGADRGGIGVVAGIFDDACHGHAAACDGALRQALRNIAVETQCLGEHQRAADAQPPAVKKMSLDHRFAHGGTAEHGGFRQQQIGVARQIDVDAAPQPRLIEHDRLLRQPCQCAAGTDVEFYANVRVWPERAVDFLRRRGGDGQPRAGADFDVDVEAVAAGHAARGIDDDGFQRGLAVAVGKAHPQRAGFVDAAAPAAAKSRRDGERDPADGAIAGEDFVA